MIDDDEAFTQIAEYFKFIEINISTIELQRLINELMEEGYISINYQWKNEKNEYPYSLTKKGREYWKNMKYED